MGRQFRFYILPSDANNVVAQLKNRFETKLLLDYSPNHELFEIDSPFRTNEAGDWEPLSESLRYYLAPPSGHIERQYCAKPNWWVINSESEGIEFCGCKFNGTALAIGRFWYETNVVRNLQFVSKSAAFLDWAEAVCRYTKKLLRYEERIAAYLGKDAISFREKGGQLAEDIWPNGKVIPA
jgi:hypothetical protein